MKPFKKPKYGYNFQERTTLDKNGKLHSIDDEPSYVDTNLMAWHKHGIIHRTSGPAIVRKNGSVRFLIKGKDITKEVILWAENNGYQVIHVDQLDEDVMLMFSIIFGSKE